MSNLVPGICFSLDSSKDLRKRPVVLELLSALMSSPTSIRPRRFGAFEATEALAQINDAVDLLMGAEGESVVHGNLVLSKSDRCTFQIHWSVEERLKLNFVAGHLMFSDIDRNPNALPDFLRLVKVFANILQPKYGEVRSMAVKGWDTPFNLSLRLPDIPPISIYGEELIDFFGLPLIASAPFISFETVGTCLWLVAHSLVREMVPDDVRSAIREHLGADSFMANGRWKYKDGKTPFAVTPVEQPSEPESP